MSHSTVMGSDFIGSDARAFAPFGKGGDKTRQRLVGDLLFAPRANPPSPASQPPAPFYKGGYSRRLSDAYVGRVN